MAYSENLVNTLNGIAWKYRDIINRTLNEILKQPRYRNTGAGLASLHVDVVEGNKDRAPDIQITFADHLNLLDKRKMEWTKQPPIPNLEEWAETKTFSGPVPGYKNGLAPNLPPWKAKQRIVWAIAKSKQKFDVWKGKPWRKKSLSSVLADMNREIKIAFDDAVQRDLDKASKI